MARVLAPPEAAPVREQSPNTLKLVLLFFVICLVVMLTLAYFFL